TPSGKKDSTYGSHWIPNRADQPQNGGLKPIHDKNFNTLFFDGHVQPENEKTDGALEMSVDGEHITNSGWYGPYNSRCSIIN
ncbi:MAG: hypothetical protein J6Y80_07550, partial [Victivallales bacterium]|nr:hypothetical protein [Victivallales bacterium]